MTPEQLSRFDAIALHYDWSTGERMEILDALASGSVADTIDALRLWDWGVDDVFVARAWFIIHGTLPVMP